MVNSKEEKKYNTGEPQVLRKAEIARILSTVKQAPFNAKDANSTDNSYQKRSLLDIALDASKNDPSNDTDNLISDNSSKLQQEST